MGALVRAARAVGMLAACLILTACPSADEDGRSPVEGGASAAGSSQEPGTTSLAGAWVDVTEEAIGTTAEWTNKVELADLDADGDVDVLLANGGDYDTPGTPVPSRALLNRGDGTFDDASESVFGDTRALTRVIKAADVDADRDVDIVLGTTYDTQSRLFLSDGTGGWQDATQQLPVAQLSAGDLELGDVDGDDDLDIVIADWGDSSPLGPGGRVALWLNDGAGSFTDASEQMPSTLVRFSWDLELVDVDNDWDLDVAVSCKLCSGSHLFSNDGAGTFADVTEGRMPAYTNNYEFAPVDLDADGYLDLITINDGERRAAGLSEHVFRNQGDGTFADVTEDWWPEDANPGYDDNVVVGLDVESDGDGDFLIGSLDGPDRLLVNDGSGRLSLVEDVFTAEPSMGTLGMAVADFDDDGRVDVFEAQGEVAGHENERAYRGTDVLAEDVAPPVVRVGRLGDKLVARVHDHRSSYLQQDWQSVTAAWTGGEAPMTWYGESLFQTAVPPGASSVEVCAVDAAGNRSCARA
jgi:hypothetical protein